MEDFSAEIIAVLARTGDPEPYNPTLDEMAEIEVRANVFAEITRDFPVAVGKHASTEDREEFKISDATLTYGEVDFVSFAEVFALIKSRYGGFGDGIFYDLGSGSGKGVIAAAVLHPFAQCKGIEVLKSLHRLSAAMKQLYDALMPRFVEAHPNVFSRVPEVSFEHGSFFDIPFSSACCFFANSTCFSLDMMQQIADVPLAIGSLALTLTKNLPGPQWLVLESFRKKMSWGEATVYIHRRVDPVLMTELRSKYSDTTYWYS